MEKCDTTLERMILEVLHAIHDSLVEARAMVNEWSSLKKTHLKKLVELAQQSILRFEKPFPTVRPKLEEDRIVKFVTLEKA